MLRRFQIAGLASALLAGTAVHAQSSLELLEAGAAPRQPVRYQFESGRTERAELDTNLQMTISLGGQPLPAGNVPPMQMVMELRSTEVAPDGSARIEFELLSSEAAGSDAQAAQMNQAMAAMKGLKGWYRVDPRGQLSSGQITLPDGNTSADAAAGVNDLEQTMQQMAAPFPEEAIGPGARWRVVQKVDTNNLQMSQTVEYTLRSRNGNQVVLDVKLLGAEMEQLAGMPAQVKLDSLQMQGGGTSTLQLDRLVPQGTVDADIALKMTMEAQGQVQNMAMDMKIKQAIAPASE